MKRSMVTQSVFQEEHLIFRRNFQRFLRTEVVPQQERWRTEGIVDRSVWQRAGGAGFLCPWLEEQYGGPGGDFLHSVVVMEELANVYETGFAMSLHSDIVVPYIHEFGTEVQKARWLPKCASGELVTAIAMTEPDTGSDLAAIRTTARRVGEDYVIDGAKMFITNGILADLCIVAAKSSTAGDRPHDAISLFVVEADRSGFVKAKNLDKVGMHSQDTAELVFEGCRVPADNMLGRDGAGFAMLMDKLQQERICVAAAAQASAEACLRDTVRYVTERQAFGQPISKFQNTQFQLAECATKIEVGRSFLEKLLRGHMAGESLVKESSMAKLWHTEMLGEVVDACLQLFGGYGYMTEYPISRAYVDARVQRIYAGSNEIMKVIISKQIGL